MTCLLNMKKIYVIKHINQKCVKIFTISLNEKHNENSNEIL